MEDLIFVLPTFILFFFIIFRVLSLFKRGFDFVRKNFDLTIEEAGEELKRNTNKMDAGYDQSEVEKRIRDAEKESIAKSKERILSQSRKNENQDSQQKNKEKIKEESLDQDKIKKRNSSLGEIFSSYNEVEKAVIYSEILSKPKALKRD